MNAPAPGFQPDSRERNIERLRTEEFDVLVVGGGINGAGILRDLALRSSEAGEPRRLALIDKAHFASGTSGRNSQLIHGGLRYLKNLEFGLVREALRERAALLEIAPHLVEPLPLLIPFYSWVDRRFYGTGLWLYDLLAGNRNIGRRRYLSRDEVAGLEPELSREGLHSAGVYFDCLVHSARLLLENLFDASRMGAAVVNYVEATGWRSQGGGFTVELTDRLGGERLQTRARRLVDARGPWEGSRNLRLVRGSHIVLPRLTRSKHAIAWFGPDGRIIFVIPWGENGDLSLVGTTDIDHPGSPDGVRISREEIDYLRGVLKRLFPGGGEFEPLAAYSSLRPLVAGGKESATATSRSHKIWMEDGILKIAGGKYTTYRAMSEEAVDLLEPQWAGRCRTASVPLGGNSREAIAEAGRRFPESRVRHFGVQVWNAAEASECEWAVRHEMARRLADFLFVSTYRGHERRWTEAELAPLAEQMGRLLGWSQDRMTEEIRLALSLSRMPSPAEPPPPESRRGEG